MFDTLLLLPLFQGLAQEDLTSILAKVKLHFVKHRAGAIIVKADTPCDRLVFILRGEIGATVQSADGTYSLTEYQQAPCLIEPQSLFGMNTRYVGTYVAQEEVHTVSIDKSFVMNELFKYEIFRLNYLNIISNRAQNLVLRLWSTPERPVDERIAHFILSRCERPTGRKSLKIKMETLARIINDTRLNVSKSLNALQASGLLELRRGEIIIHEASLLK